MSAKDALKEALKPKGNNQGQDNQEGPDGEELPDKYKGKSQKEIARMHSEAEKRLGQQGVELGELRGRVDELSRRPDLEDKQQQAPELTKDDIIDEVIESLPKDSLEMEPGELVRAVADGVDRISEMKLKEFEETRIKPIQNQAVQTEALNVVQEVAGRYSDFDDNIEKIQEVVNKPLYQQVLDSATGTEKVEILDDIYHLVKGRSSSQSNGSANKARMTGGSSAKPGNSGDSQSREALGKRVRESILGRGRG